MHTETGWPRSEEVRRRLRLRQTCVWARECSFCTVYMNSGSLWTDEQIPDPKGDSNTHRTHQFGSHTFCPVLLMFPFPSEEKSSETHHWIFWLLLVRNLKETSLQMQLCSVKSITIRSSLLGFLHFFCQFSNLFVPALDLEANITRLGSLWLQTPGIQIQAMLDSPWLKYLFLCSVSQQESLGAFNSRATVLQPSPDSSTAAPYPERTQVGPVLPCSLSAIALNLRSAFLHSPPEPTAAVTLYFLSPCICPLRGTI